MLLNELNHLNLTVTINEFTVWGGNQEIMLVVLSAKAVQPQITFMSFRFMNRIQNAITTE